MTKEKDRRQEIEEAFLKMFRRIGCRKIHECHEATSNNEVINNDKKIDTEGTGDAHWSKQGPNWKS